MPDTKKQTLYPRPKGRGFTVLREKKMITLQDTYDARLIFTGAIKERYEFTNGGEDNKFTMLQLFHVTSPTPNSDNDDGEPGEIREPRFKWALARLYNGVVKLNLFDHKFQADYFMAVWAEAFTHEYHNRNGYQATKTVTKRRLNI